MSLRILPRLHTRLLPRVSPPQARRPFLTIATGPLRFSESRAFPYAPGPLYTLVSDIDSYHKFLPYCLGSAVTKYSDPGSLPTEADLRVGWGAYDETFSSRVLCEPDKLIVRADASPNELFQTLKTRWEIRQRDGDGGSDVALHIEFQFRNPVYAALSGAVAPGIVSVMVAAFERRAKDILGEGEGEEGGVGARKAVGGGGETN